MAQDSKPLPISKPGQSIYCPSRYGEIYHAVPFREVLGGGSAGVGKTEILMMDPMAQVAVEHERCINKRHPYPLPMGGSKGWALHLRRTLPELEQTIQRSLRTFPQIDPGAHFDKVKTTWTFTSGYHYQFGHCQNAGDWGKYFGTEYTFLAFDELVTFLRIQYEMITSRLRTNDPVLINMLKIRSMSNPIVQRMEGENYAVDPFWVRERFVDPPAKAGEVRIFRAKNLAGETVEQTRLFLPGTLADHPDKAFRDSYEATLLFKPSHIRAALLYGNWYVNEGSYFGDVWNESMHVIKPHHIPPGWGRFRSMDWGFKKPGCLHWWAMDQDGNLICERELMFVGKTVREVGKRIKEIEVDLGLWRGKRSLITGPADTQLWEKRGEEGLSKAEEFSQIGISWVPADKKSRSHNAERLAERLKDHGNGTTMPGIMFFDSCKKIVQYIPSVQATPGDPDTPVDGGDDHAGDSCFYACAHASRGRASITTVDTRSGPKDPDDDDDDKEPETAARGAWGYG